MPRFSKSDISFHSDHGPRVPAVNVKVYDSLASGMGRFRSDNPDADPRFTEEWIDANISQDAQYDWFNIACEHGFEDLQNDAQEIWGSHVKVYSQGRSGGWAVVDGIDTDVESWDAVAVMRWARWAKWARGTADYTMALVCDLIYINVFEQWAEEQSERIGADAFAPEAMSL